jgi:hypothetical protein
MSPALGALGALDALDDDSFLGWYSVILPSHYVWKKGVRNSFFDKPLFNRGPG